MSSSSTSGPAKGRAPDAAAQNTKTVEDYAREYEEIMDRELPVSLGFSARLNMLWDLAGTRYLPDPDYQLPIL